MSKLVTFCQISLDGFFTDTNGDFKWSYNPIPDEEFKAFVESNAQGGGILMFGRKTYEIMAGYWPTPKATQNDPVVAEHMNNRQKIVISKTLPAASWNNTRIVSANLLTEVRKLKDSGSLDIAVLGSGSIIAQLAGENLIDEYQFVIIPVVLGSGRAVFDGLKHRIGLKLKNNQSFKNGNVFVSYEPVSK